MEFRVCQNCKNQFQIEDDDLAFYSQIHVPLPTWCWKCRMVRRMVFRNQRHLFRRKDDASGKEIFSSFPPQSSIRVYEHDYWWGDDWDPAEYGREYDFSRPFFEQFRQLLYSVPVLSRSVINLINSDYSDQSGWLKNCYFCFNLAYSEDSAYAASGVYIKDSLDTYQSKYIELCYEAVMVDKSYRVFFSFDCNNCSDVWFSKGLVGCTNCFGCSNLSKKSYHIFNRPYTKEEYYLKLREFNLGSYTALEELKKEVADFWRKFPVKYYHGYQNTNFSGEHIKNTKNVHHSWLVYDAQNVKYSQDVGANTTDVYDVTSFGIDAFLLYESLTVGYKSSKIKFCWECWNGVEDLEYSVFCTSSSHLFGCVGMRNKKYCILNKQYSQDEFGELRKKIIKHIDEMPYIDAEGRVYKYGEFFPPEFSPFAYKETMAYDFFPLSEAEAKDKGFLWREAERPKYQITMQAADLPDHINDVDDSILKEVIACLSCGRPYRIIPMELRFYRKIALPLARICPDCRFWRRLRLVNPPQFWYRKCQCAGGKSENGVYTNTNLPHPAHKNNEHCPNEFETSYAPGRPENVYCETCYQAEII